jgi:hypothetical protein
MAAFRIHLAGHPLLLTLALLFALGAARFLWRRWVTRKPTRTHFGFGVLFVSLIAIVTYVALVIFYATDPHYFDAAEPTMTAVGWLFHLGQPIYHSVDSAERYAHIYGPMAFIAHGVALGLFGPSIEVSKWVGGSAALLSLCLTLFALKTQTTLWRAVVITGLFALLMLGFRHYSFWTRAEPLLIFCVSAGLLAAVQGRGSLSSVALGVFAGLLWNLKATGLIYSLPVFVILFQRLGWRATYRAALIAVVVAILPFIALANVSLGAYVTWFRLSAANGLVWPLFTRNLEWAAYFLVPVVLALLLKQPVVRYGGLVILSTLAAVALVVIAGSKPGAGPYHLMPLLPVTGFLVASFIGRENALNPPAPIQLTLASFVAVAAAIALVQQAQFVTTMQGRRPLHEIRDIETFVSEHPGVVEMGYGVNDPWTFERPVLVFRNNAYLLDAPAVGEHQLAGIPVPQATLDALRQCRIAYWLIPKGEAPFTGQNFYEAVLRPIFSDEFRRVFHESHRLTASTQYFDAWQCHPAK